MHVVLASFSEYMITSFRVTKALMSPSLHAYKHIKVYYGTFG